MTRPDKYDMMRRTSATVSRVPKIAQPANPGTETNTSPGGATGNGIDPLIDHLNGMRGAPPFRRSVKRLY